jgi:hypothetical protein
MDSVERIQPEKKRIQTKSSPEMINGAINKREFNKNIFK